MTTKTANHVFVMLMQDAEEKRACLKLIREEYEYAKTVGDTELMRSMKSVAKRLTAALRETEDALNDICGMVDMTAEYNERG